MHTSLYPYQHELLVNNLTKIFGTFDDTMLALLEPKLEWLDIGGAKPCSTRTIRVTRFFL